MLYRRYTPPAPLRAFVSCIWYSHGLQGTHERERLLPNGESGIIFDLRDQPVHIYDANDISKFETYAPAIFSGARTDCFVIDTSRQERVIGIQFRPGGAFPFLGIPPSEFANATCALDDIWPAHAASIRDALLNAPSVDAMFAILEQALLSRLKLTLHPAVPCAARLLSSQADTLRVRDVAEHVGLSSHRLMELFRLQTGLTPKAFQRVRRFQQVLQRLRSNTPENWADLAITCGYYDQAHFIHDFRLFAGMTPGEYVTMATPHLNHVPLK